MVMWRHRSSDSRRSFPIAVLWNQASITDGFRHVQRQMWRNCWHDLDTTSKQKSKLFILVPIDFSYDVVNSNFCEDRRQINATL